MKRTLCTMKTKFLTLLLLTSTLTAGAQMYFGTKKEVPDSVFNALAQTPPMGWNSWNKFGCNVSEQLIKEDETKKEIYRSIPNVFPME